MRHPRGSREARHLRQTFDQRSVNVIRYGPLGSTPDNANVYDIDEFRLPAEAVTAATIAQGAAGSSPVALPFTAGCGASLRRRRAPTPGNDVHFCIE